MLRTVILAAGERKSLRMSGRHLYIEAATADFEMTVVLGSGVNDVDTYSARSRLVLDDKLERLELHNTSGAPNTITLRTGWVAYYPPINTTGSAVTVEPGSAPLQVEGPLTDAELRAAAVPVSGEVAVVAAEDGGADRHRLVSAATTNATGVKNAAGKVYAINGTNTGAACFLKLYDKASAPTVGTDVPVETYALPAGGTFSFTFGNVGSQFAAGIALAITGLIADADTTAIAANQVVMQLHYY